VENQSLAAGAARGNLSDHAATGAAAQEAFMAALAAAAGAQQAVLDGYEGAVEALRRVELHPLLASAGRATLLDCVRADTLREHAARCAALRPPRCCLCHTAAMC
jgi:hypothetical protein